jgi:hypothetical protein
MKYFHEGLKMWVVEYEGNKAYFAHEYVADEVLRFWKFGESIKPRLPQVHRISA